MRAAWEGLKVLSGQNKPQSGAYSMPEKDRIVFAEKLNAFYCRFERDDLQTELSDVILDLQGRVGDKDSDDTVIEESVVCSLFKRLNIRKACGPDGVGGRILRCCADQLSLVFSKLFTWSVEACIVPSLYKNSKICPVPKNRSPSELNDYRPVALTSIAMKCFERIILSRLVAQTQNQLDPFQFAYKHNRSTDDATLTLLDNAYSHLDKSGSYVRILFIDFSSAFNTIQPHLMALKLQKLDVDPRLTLWLVDFLVNRSQSVCFQQAISSSRTTSTGSPQGTVLSPVLFTLYTNDCRGSDDTLLVKYSDDSALADLSNSHSTYVREVEIFRDWCKDNYLDLNVKKTKELVIDFRRNAPPVPDLSIDGVRVERVDEYKYLGTVIDNKLNFNANTVAIHKKCQSRLYCLQKLRSLGVSKPVLLSFYRCFLESVLTFGFLCWYGGLSVKNKNVLDRVVKISGRVVGENVERLCQLYERRAVCKGVGIQQDSTHVLNHHFEPLPSGRRLRVPNVSTLRARNSFTGKAIRFLNRS